jgi:Tfp pilus assembly protein PilO
MKPGLFRNSWVVTLTLAGLVVAYLFLYFLPKRKGIDAKRAELSGVTDFLQQAEIAASALQANRAVLEKTNRYNAKWKPPRAEEPAICGQVVALADAAGATLATLSPIESTSNEPYERIRRIPVEVECSGSFAQISRLLDGLERLDQAIWVDTFLMEKSGEDGENVQCKLTLAVFADNPDDSDQVDPSQ